jgi:hypothetical protein
MDGRQTPSDGKSSPCLWQGELKIKTKLLQYFEKSYYRVPYYKSAHLTIPRATTLYIVIFFIYINLVSKE